MIRIVILALALLTGGGAAWLATSLLGPSEAPPVAEAPEPFPTGEVLVARTAAARGTELGPEMLEWQPWPEPAIGEGMVLREDMPEAVETYTGWISRSPLMAGEPVRADRLAEGDGGLMSLMLTPGMRAVAVRVSAETAAGGFIIPNDRVDVLHTVMRDSDGDGTDEPVSTTIIRNARVLAVDQVSEMNETGTAKVAETATLELTPQQVEVLTTARNSGRLAMALRSVADYGETELGGIAYALPGGVGAGAAAAWPAEGSARSGPDSTLPAAAMQSDVQGPSAPRPATEIRIIGSGQIETVRLDSDDG